MPKEYNGTERPYAPLLESYIELNIYYSTVEIL